MRVVCMQNSAQSDEEAALNGHSYECFRKHYSARHKNVKYQVLAKQIPMQLSETHSDSVSDMFDCPRPYTC